MRCGRESWAAGPGPLNAGILASVPQAPAVANLDITTLCSLVSGLTHGAAHRADAAALALQHKRWFKARGGPCAKHLIRFADTFSGCDQGVARPQQCYPWLGWSTKVQPGANAD